MASLKKPRRSRYVDEKDDGKPLEITERDIQWFLQFQAHGKRLLTTCFRPVGHPQSDKTRRNRLNGKRYIVRPRKQKRGENPLRNPLLFEATEKIDEVLKKKGLYSPYALKPEGWFEHQVMGSCISSSIAEECRLMGYSYLPQYAVLDRVKPELHKQRNGEVVKKKLKLTAKDKTELQGDPDEICMIGFPADDLLGIWEWDRGTEQTRRQEFTALNKETWTDKVAFIKLLLGNEKSGYPYMKAYGVECPAAAFIVTISEAKMDGIIDVIADAYPNGCDRIYVTYMPRFSTDDFRIPKGFINVLGATWYRHGYDPVSFIPSQFSTDED